MFRGPRECSHKINKKEAKLVKLAMHCSFPSPSKRDRLGNRGSRKIIRCLALNDEATLNYSDF